MSDPKQGADLFQMAKDGTSIPNDAGKQNTVPSVPNPHQKEPSTQGGLGTTNLHDAADNASLPMGEKRAVGVGEGISATGHEMPMSAAGKPASGHGGTGDGETHRKGPSTRRGDLETS